MLGDLSLWHQWQERLKWNGQLCNPKCSKCRQYYRAVGRMLLLLVTTPWVIISKLLVGSIILVKFTLKGVYPGNYVDLSSLFSVSVPFVFSCVVCPRWFLGDCKLKKLNLIEELIKIKDKISKFKLAESFWPKTSQASKSTKGGRVRSLIHYS